MLFPTFEFFLFFTLVLILNWFLKRWPLTWRLFLLLTSYFFYSLWDLKFLLILFLVSLFNFMIGLIVNKGKLFLFLGITVNLLTLGVFKYYDFFRISFESFLRNVGFVVSLPFLEIILPIGLSFYIFKTTSYLIDVYRKKINPATSWLDFFIFVSFFPQILAGPIARADDFLPQLKEGGAKKIENAYYNITLIVIGLFKKLAISSYLALNITDDVFAVPQNHSSLVIFLAIISYYLVIYFDFSGYSDMAIGFAGLLGFKSPINFDFPYLATSLKEFWRKWHITLSFWIRDYIYIPLGGNRKGELRKYLNLITSMVLAGLWHGAAGHFVFWGFFHGVGVTIDHAKDYLLRNALKGKSKILEAIEKSFSWVLTFVFVAIGWIFFRSDSIKTAFEMIKRMFSFEGSEPFQSYIILMIIIGFLFFIFEKQIIRGLTNIQGKMRYVFWILFVIILITLIFKLSPETVPPFIYFSF